jgi:hypothetical protein
MTVKPESGKYKMFSGNYSTTNRIPADPDSIRPVVFMLCSLLFLSVPLITEPAFRDSIAHAGTSANLAGCQQDLPAAELTRQVNFRQLIISVRTRNGTPVSQLERFGSVPRSTQISTRVSSAINNGRCSLSGHFRQHGI